MSRANKNDWTLLIDDDAMLNTNYNKYILKAINDYTDILAFSGKVVTDGKIDYAHRRYCNDRFKIKFSKKEDYASTYFDCDLASFCGLYIKNSIIDKIGLPEKGYFIHFDDTEYSFRIKKISKIRNVNAAWLDHKTVYANNIGTALWKLYYGKRNQLNMVKKHGCKRLEYKYMINYVIMILGCYVFYYVKRDNRYMEMKNMYMDALIDGEKGKLGKNEKYLPGKK